MSRACLVEGVLLEGQVEASGVKSVILVGGVVVVLIYLLVLPVLVWVECVLERWAAKFERRFGIGNGKSKSKLERAS